MPSSMLQSRIQQFEALESRSKSPKASTSNGRQPITRKPVMYPPSNAANKHHAISIRNPLDDPISPAAAAFSTMKPTLPYVPRKPRSTSVSPSPPNLGIKTSLIDLKDWNDDISGVQSVLPSQNFNKSNIQKKANVVAPALPPRNNSSTSQKSVPLSTPYSSKPKPPDRSKFLETQSLLKTSDALSPKHSYPPDSTLSATNSRQSQGHNHASSTSSFQSISLSSDSGGPSQALASNMSSRLADNNDRDVDVTDDSFSFETISSGAISNQLTSSTQDWEHDLSLINLRDHSAQHNRSLKSPPPPPPMLPTVSSKSPPITKPVTAHNPSRRVPPPIPPSRTKPSSHRVSLTSTATASDQSSIFSNKTSTSEQTSQSVHTPLSRPTPVPPAARKRYENLFDNCLSSQQQMRKSKPKQEAPNSLAPTIPRKGWRGLSVDIVTNPPEPSTSFSGDDADEQATENLDKELDGRYVKHIWMQSKLSKEKLRIIWDEVAVREHRFIDREAFVRGMWLIDEELRRAQNMRESLARGRLSGKS